VILFKKRQPEDNGTNFIGANSELKEAIKTLDNKRINDHLTKHAIESMDGLCLRVSSKDCETSTEDSYH